MSQQVLSLALPARGEYLVRGLPSFRFAQE